MTMPKMGRPTKYQPEFCQAVVDLMGQGLCVAQVCRKWGICKQTFYNWTEEHADFLDAHKKGRTAIEAWYIEQLLKHASGGVKGGNITGLIFAGKNVAGLRDTQDVKVETSGSVEVKHEVKLAGISDAFMSKVQTMMLKEAAKGDKPKKGD